ncbi:hypothetical protein A9K55_005543 [Cordyceps militaris]|uniref:Uncharacterized protein n=1 Tax=Cordyceps militaris TaxID=73501 RepID=A0A2H4SCX2_CORMI|nr:hypothetical protein A9K55_005543 [Cordyceps militaris]
MTASKNRRSPHHTPAPDKATTVKCGTRSDAAQGPSATGTQKPPDWSRRVTCSYSPSALRHWLLFTVVASHMRQPPNTTMTSTQPLATPSTPSYPGMLTDKNSCLTMLNNKGQLGPAQSSPHPPDPPPAGLASSSSCDGLLAALPRISTASSLLGCPDGAQNFLLEQDTP